MTNRMVEILTCPICIQLLRKPILILPCQHSLCKVCIIQLWNRKELGKRCPTCRQEFSQELSNVDALPRNFTIEAMVEELDQTIASCQRPETSNKIDVKSLSELASRLIKMKQYDKAIEPLSTLDDHSKGLEGIDTRIELIQCYIETENNLKVEKLTHTLHDLLRRVNVVGTDAKIASSKLQNFAKKLTTQNYPLKAIIFLKLASDVCETLENPTEKLEEHMICLELMQGVTKCMKRNDRKKEFKEIAFPTIHRIYCNFTRVQLQNKKEQCIKTAWCLKYIGFCCNEIGDFAKSLEYNSRAVDHLQKHLQHEAKLHRVLGISYHNLAAAYKNLERFEMAEQAYLQAIESFHKAEDWPNCERRNNSVILSAIGLSEVHSRIKK